MVGKVQALRVRVAAARYGNPTRSMRLIIVAGAHGKTTTARLLTAILKESGQAVTVITDGHDTSIDACYKLLADAKKRGSSVVVMEVSDALLRTGVLASMLIDTIVVTNESPATKELLSELSPQHVIIPSESHIETENVEMYRQITVGEDSQAEARIKKITLYRKGTELQLTIDHQIKLEIATPLVGIANAYNLATASAAAYVLGVDVALIQEAVADIETTPGNFEWITPASQTYKLFVDEAHDPSSLEQVLSSAKQFTKRRFIVALGDEVSEEVIPLLQKYADRVFVVNKQAEDLPNAVENTESVEEVYKKAVRSAKQDDVVALLGARFAKLEDGMTYAKKLIEASE